MNPGRVHRAIEALRIVLGVVVLIQSVQALLPRETGAHSALLAHLLPVLAGVSTSEWPMRRPDGRISSRTILT